MRSRTSTTDRSGPDGFTLLELLAVLAIVGLIAAIAVPRLQPPAIASEAGQAARALANGLARARQLAIFQNRETILKLDLDRRSWQLPADPATSFSPGLDVAFEGVARDITGPRAGGIRFFPDGSSTGGTITLTDGDKNKFKLTVNWLTGRIGFDG